MDTLKEMTLGRRIQKLRKAQALTQDALTETLGVTPQAVSKWETDQSCPDIMTLPQLAQQLQVSIDTLLTGEAAASALQPAAPAKKPEELIVRIQFEEESFTRICCNLPFTVFKLGARFGFLSLTYTSESGDEVDFERVMMQMKNIDFAAMVQLIENGMYGKLFDYEEDGVKLTIWTE